MIKVIGDNIVELSFIFLGFTFIVGLGFLINADENRKQMRYEICIEAGMQYSEGSCTR